MSTMVYKETSTEYSPEGEGSKTGWTCGIDREYIRSRHGILSAVITIVSLIALICVRSTYYDISCYYYGAASFFGFVSGTAFLTTLIGYIIHILTFHKRFKFIPWNIADLIFCGIWTILYLISSILIMAMSCGQAGFLLAGIFGFGAMFAMAVKAYDAFVKFREERNRAQATNGQDPENSGGLTEIPPPPYSQY